jgi:hypothetical protein
MAHARRTHACAREPIVEPRRRAIAEVRADRLMQRREHLQQEKDDGDQRERGREAAAALHGRDEDAHGQREHGGQHPAQQNERPPGDRERAIGGWKDGEERPFVPCTQAREHESPPGRNRADTCAGRRVEADDHSAAYEMIWLKP